jgi:uncharacterized protein YbjT (DUF2867 family)
MTAAIAIIGSSGRNAGAWSKAFLAAGYFVRRLVRHPTNAASQPNVSEVPFDLDDPATYAPALRGAALLALITPADPRQTERELALIAAAKSAAVGRILNVSVIGADLHKPVSPFARWQAPVEAALAASGMPHVTLRPSAYMQNVLMQRSGIESGRYVEPSGEAASSLIDVNDIADCAVAVARGDDDGAALDLTGPEALTGREIASLLGQARGVPVSFVSPPIEAFRQALLEQGAPRWRADGLAELYRSIEAGAAGHIARVTDATARLLGRPPQTFGGFARENFGSCEHSAAGA